MYENPCKPDCPDRTPTCHSDCPAYIAFEILNGIVREQKYREKQTEDDCLKTSRHFKKKKRRRPYADNRGGR